MGMKISGTNYPDESNQETRFCLKINLQYYICSFGVNLLTNQQICKIMVVVQKQEVDYA